MASDKLKGHSGRLITIPGYHLHPQFDMVHTRALIFDRKNKKRGFSLSLAPMVDMFSILVIYLLMNFSSSGEAFFVSKDIVIPKATKGTPMKSFPLLSVVNGAVTFETELAPGQSATAAEDLSGPDLPQLRNMLQRLKKVSEQISAGEDTRNQVNVQADENAPIEDVKKVMRILIEEGWTGINFIVDPSSGKATQAAQ